MPIATELLAAINGDPPATTSLSTCKIYLGMRPATAGCSTDSRSDFACSITVSSQQGEELQENAVSGSVKKCKLGRPGESAIASQSRQNKGSRE